MPEGPEIFLAARAVHAAVAGQAITLALRHADFPPHTGRADYFIARNANPFDVMSRAKRQYKR